MTRRPSYGHPKLGMLTGWHLLTIFGAVVVRGWLRNGPFLACVLCFDGAADHPTSLLWTDRGRVTIRRADRERWLVGA